MNLEKELDLAKEAALNAGKILKELYLKPHQIIHKGEIDLVTEADIASEKTIKEILNKSVIAPILAEESTDIKLTQNKTMWIVDPLDGTTNFAHGFPWFCVSIALWDKDNPLIGVIYLPIFNECFWAVKGLGAFLNGKKIEVSDTSLLNSALLATGFPYDVRKYPDKVIAALKDMIVKCQGIRRAGAAAIDMAYVACGRLDGFWEIKLKPWDTAAGLLLIQEAGGKVTDFSNNKYNPWIKEVLASNNKIHKEMVDVLKRFHQNYE